MLSTSPVEIFQDELFVTLPDELQFAILSQLTPQELLDARLVSRKFALFLLDNKLWKEKCCLHFPEEYAVLIATAREEGEINWFRTFLDYMQDDKFYTVKKDDNGEECSTYINVGVMKYDLKILFSFIIEKRVTELSNLLLTNDYSIDIFYIADSKGITFAKRAALLKKCCCGC